MLPKCVTKMRPLRAICPSVSICLIYLDVQPRTRRPCYAFPLAASSAATSGPNRMPRRIMRLISVHATQGRLEGSTWMCAANGRSWLLQVNRIRSCYAKMYLSRPSSRLAWGRDRSAYLHIPSRQCLLTVAPTSLSHARTALPLARETRTHEICYRTVEKQYVPSLRKLSKLETGRKMYASVRGLLSSAQAGRTISSSCCSCPRRSRAGTR